MVHKFVYHAVFVYICTRQPDRELVEITEDGVFLEDPVFKIWLSR